MAHAHADVYAATPVVSRIDVLAWVDAKVQREREAMWATGLPNEQLDEMVRIRAAVAELIAHIDTMQALIEFRIDDPRAAILDNLRAALARVGGAA